jgi:tetratricopeptide (TPR) repeat protein
MEDLQIEQEFIGHEREMETFKQWLLATDPQRAWILFFSDALEKPEQKGGVGKTWLLHRCAALTRRLRSDIAVVTIDFFSLVDRNSITIAQRVAESVQNVHPQWRAPTFLQLLAEYQAATLGRKDMPNIEERLHNALVADLAELDRHLENTGKQLLFFFDTFEVIEQHPLIAVAGTGPARTFPDRYGFHAIGAVIAGRNPPDWAHQNWNGREAEVLSVPVEPFKVSEMVQFFDHNCTVLSSQEVTPAQIEIFHERTQGRPILIGLAVDVLNHHLGTLDDLLTASALRFEEYLVTHINRLEHPINWVVLFMAHVYHRFNTAMLRWIFQHSIDIKELIQDVNLEELEKKLLGLSFVRVSEHADNLALHDEMRRLVNLYNWRALEQPTEGFRRELSRVITGYYEQELALSLSEQLRQSYTVEMLYHKLFMHSADSFAFFKRHFDRAIGLWQSAFARVLLDEIKRSGGPLLEAHHDDLLLAEASLFWREENNAQAVALYTQVEAQADPGWLAGKYARLLFEKAVCYNNMSQLPEAIETLNRSLAVAQTNNDQSHIAHVLGWLGAIHKRLGELEKARGYYESSIALYRERGDERGYADILTALSTIYRLQGKLEEALRRCTVAWRIRQDLYTQGLASEIGVGFSLSAMGATYLKLGDMTGAQRAFQEAYEIYLRNTYQQGIADSYNRFGYIAMTGHDYERALLWFHKAYQLAVGTNADAEMNSLNKLGWTYVLQGRFLEAVPPLQKAVERARQVHDDYQQAESLIDLAYTYAALHRYEAAVQLLDLAEAITGKYLYYFLWGLIDVQRGEIELAQQHTSKAFRHFADSCYHMAAYNPLEYEKAIREIISRLLTLKRSEVRSILQDFLAYWATHSLDEKTTTSLSRALEEVSQLLAL